MQTVFGRKRRNLEKEEKPREEKNQRREVCRILAINQSKVRVGLSFNNLESMILKMSFNML